jgi:hypothetical protein
MAGGFQFGTFQSNAFQASAFQMSDFSTFCAAVVSDLTANIGALSGVTTHMLAPWAPEERVNDGKAHLAVWPVADLTERASRLMLGADDVEQVYKVAYWEPAGTESDRQVLDTTAAGLLFDLQNAIRARLYRAAFAVTGYYRIFYTGTQFPERSSQVRWFEMEVSATTALAFT